MAPAVDRRGLLPVVFHLEAPGRVPFLLDGK